MICTIWNHDCGTWSHLEPSSASGLLFSPFLKLKSEPCKIFKNLVKYRVLGSGGSKMEPTWAPKVNFFCLLKSWKNLVKYRVSGYPASSKKQPTKTKLFFVRFLEGCGVPRNPVFYKVCFKILGIKKSARLGPMLATSWTLLSPKPCSLQGFWRFYKVRFWAPKMAKRAPRISKMASSPPILVPDSTDHTHPVAHTLKRFVHAKPPR